MEGTESTYPFWAVLVHNTKLDFTLFTRNQQPDDCIGTNALQRNKLK